MSVRWRLAFLYAVITAFLLPPASLVAYTIHVRAQYQELDRSLLRTAEHFESDLLSAGAGDGLVAQPIESDVAVRIYHRTSEPILTPGSSAEPLLSPLDVIARDEGPAYPALVRLIPGGSSVERGAFATARDPGNGGRVRLFALPGGQGGQPGYVLTWKPLRALDESARFLGLLLGGTVLLGIAAAGAGTFAVAGNALRPVADMTQVARAIAASRGFSRRVDEPARMDELGRLARTFNEMLSSLEEVYRSQQRFVADAAHELRTPLTAIQGNIDLMKRNPDMPAAEQIEAFSYLDSEARRLSRIVSELLTLARADAGQTLERRPVELDRVLLDALAELRPLVQDHRVELGEIEPVVVLGDPDRLKELILNLLDNSIKYTRTGGRISVALENEARGVILTVRDSGIGIGAGDLGHVFERFYRGDPARSRDPGGSGLGLAIVDWIVDQHDGEITVDSTSGQGTTVTVRLPLLVNPERRNGGAEPRSR